METEREVLRKADKDSPKCACGNPSDYSVNDVWVCLLCRPLKPNDY